LTPCLALEGRPAPGVNGQQSAEFRASNIFFVADRGKLAKSTALVQADCARRHFM